MMHPRPEPVVTDTIHALWRSGWCGNYDTNQQPVDKNGKVVAKMYSAIRTGYVQEGKLRVYIPRLMNNIPRLARALKFARRRENLWWGKVVWPLVRRIHEAGGYAFAADRPHNEGFDYWQTSLENGKLSFGRHGWNPQENEEALVETAREVMARKIRGANVELGLALTKAHQRVSFSGDLEQRRGIVETCLEWALRETVERNVGRVTPTDSGPRVACVTVEGIGDWIFTRDRQGYDWEIASDPLHKVARIHIEDRCQRR